MVTHVNADASASASQPLVSQGAGLEAGNVAQESTIGVVITRLAELPDKTLMSEHALAQALEVSVRTFQRLVAQGHLPPGVGLGGKRLWFVGRVLDWLTHRAEQAEKEASRFTRRQP